MHTTNINNSSLKTLDIVFTVVKLILKIGIQLLDDNLFQTLKLLSQGLIVSVRREKKKVEDVTRDEKSAVGFKIWERIFLTP